MGIRPREQQALNGPGNLLNTNCIQRDPESQDTWQTTYRNVSRPFRWFQDSIVRNWPGANKIQMFWVDVQGMLLFPGICSPFYPEYTRISPDISFVCSPQLRIESPFIVCVLEFLSKHFIYHSWNKTALWKSCAKQKSLPMSSSFTAITTSDLFSMWL